MGLDKKCYCSLEERTRSYTVKVPQEYQENKGEIVSFQECQRSDLCLV